MLLSPLIPVDVTTVPAPQHPVLQVHYDVPGFQDATSADSASALESITADLAGDLPELLLATPLPLTQTTRVDQQMRQPLYALPHPFPERPQRPPRLIAVTA